MLKKKIKIRNLRKNWLSPFFLVSRSAPVSPNWFYAQTADKFFQYISCRCFCFLTCIYVPKFHSLFHTFYISHYWILVSPHFNFAHDSFALISLSFQYFSIRIFFDIFLFSRNLISIVRCSLCAINRGGICCLALTREKCIGSGVWRWEEIIFG